MEQAKLTDPTTDNRRQPTLWTCHPHDRLRQGVRVTVKFIELGSVFNYNERGCNRGGRGMPAGVDGEQPEDGGRQCSLAVLRIDRFHEARVCSRTNTLDATYTHGNHLGRRWLRFVSTAH